MGESDDSLFGFLAAGSAIVFVGFVVQKGLALATTYLIATSLGTAGYGAIRIGVVVLTFSRVFAILGIDTGVARYLPRYESLSERRGALVSSLQIVGLTSLTVGLGIFVFSPTIANILGDSSMTPIIRIFGLTVPFTALMNLALGGIQGVKKSIPRTVTRSITLPVARFVAIAVALSLGLQTIGVAGAYLFGYLIALLVATYYLWRYTPLFDTLPTPSKHRELLTFSVPLLVTAVADTVFSDIDVLILSYLGTPTNVAIYSVAFTLANLLMVVLLSFRFLAMPILSELHSETKFDDMRHVYRVLTKWLFLLVSPLLFVLLSFPESVLSVTFGTEYLGGAVALSILSVGMAVHVIVGPAGATLVSVGETRLQMFDYLGASALNIVLNVLLIPRYPVAGAAVATTLSFLVLNLLYVVQLRQHVGIRPYTRDLPTMAVAITFVGVGARTATGYLTETPWITLLIGIVAFIPGYALVLVLFALGPEEREVFAKLRNRVT